MHASVFHAVSFFLTSHSKPNMQLSAPRKRHMLRLSRHSQRDQCVRVTQQPELSQTTDMALACCFLDKVLGVGCHYFPPPLDIPTFAARYLQACTTRRVELWARILSGKFSRNDELHSILGSFTRRKLRHGTDGFTSPPKEGVLRILSP